MFYLFVICFWMLSDFRINILCFGIFSYLRSFNTEILESKAKCFMWCEGRHWVAVCHTYLIFLLGTKIEYISQSPLQLSVNSRNNSFHRNVGRTDRMMYIPRVAHNHLSHDAQTSLPSSAGCMSMQGELERQLREQSICQALSEGLWNRIPLISTVSNGYYMWEIKFYYVKWLIFGGVFILVFA